MQRSSWAFVLPGVLGACATTGTSLTARYDRAAEAALEAKTRSMFTGMERGDLSEMRIEGDDTEGTIFDTDSENHPISAYGAADWNHYFDQYVQMFRSGGRVHTDVDRIDCHATTNHGYCTTEFRQTFTMNGQSMGPFRYRGTLVARRDGDRWIATHWHGSVGEVPPAPAPAPAAGTEPANSTAGQQSSGHP
jgi:ketosteroid isomerase-like protein